ncbi:hypothetical protein [Geminicoccus harenae]|uniref:hypothetical protein n=1 Tax=Geminicoccus harenae TaxID=2498453 RepID=UPI00168BF47C|nr:hypothetical protein [Geminicoccus harenae]
MKKPQKGTSTRPTQLPFIQRVRDVVIKPEEMLTFQRALEGMDPAVRGDFKASSVAVVRALGWLRDDQQRPVDPDEQQARFEKLTAMLVRFEAIRQLVDLEQFRAYRMPSADPDEPLLGEEFLHVGAAAPLIAAPDGDLSFDPDDFARRMLEHSQADGTG